ncbi:MAG: PAS domain-containing protein [Gemmatimonadota bacterium]
MPARPKNPIDRESRFEIGELFFSTTDHTGKIQSGNDVFCRVSRYRLDEMIGEPHSLIRHPDMPRAVFRVLWDYLKAGRAIAAYVKNMAADGSYYWVLATAVPIPGVDGYLSVRLKPTTQMLPVVEEAYRQLREVEREHEARGDRPGGLDASVAMLPGLLGSLGFADYDALMMQALPAEARNRDREMHLHAPSQEGGAAPTAAADVPLARVHHRCQSLLGALERQFAQLDRFLELSTKLEEKSRFLRDLAWNVRMASLNATAASARLGERGAPLAVIADAIGEQADACQSLAVALGGHNREASHQLQAAAFHTTVARLQLEMVLSFLAELLDPAALADVGGEGTVAEDGLRALITCLRDALGHVFSGYGAVVSHLSPLLSLLEDLKGLVRTLEITHLTGRVEASRVEDAGAFASLFRNVGRAVEGAREELTDFTESVDRTLTELDRLTATRRGIDRGLDEVARLLEADLVGA